MLNTITEPTILLRKVNYILLTGLFMAVLSLLALSPPAAYAQTDCVAVVGISQNQCEALVALYDSTNGPKWFDSPANKWNVTNTPCSWTGITCSGSNVVKIDRLAVGLNGHIPPELGNLANLKELWLSYNGLTGEIPPELGNLTNLEILLLSTNQLSGSIPAEVGNLTKLKELWLTNNLLSGTIPAEFGSLVNLKQLQLAKNQLMGSIPAELGNLANLLNLSLAQNQLVGNVPPELANLSGLTFLDLGYNGLSATEEPLKSFLNSKDPDWYLTQTVAPELINASVVSPTAIQINWNPIIYTQDGGYYQVKYSTSPSGSFTNVVATTSDKTASGYLVANLSPGATYFFVVVTHTPPHSRNNNGITSSMSDQISATTQSTDLITIFLPLILK